MLNLGLLTSQLILTKSCLGIPIVNLQELTSKDHLEVQDKVEMFKRVFLFNFGRFV